MPMIDLPLNELKTYMGKNPKPSDFDAYWDDALKEMKTISPDVKLEHSKFKTPIADCFDLYFTGVKGARIHAKYLRPKNVKSTHPAILIFHGYSGNSGDWSDKLNYAASGFSVFALDCRGQGGFSEDKGGVSGTTLRGHIIRGLDGKPEDFLMRHIFLDTAQLASIAMNMPEVDNKNVFATGGSQGGALTITCAALEPRIKKLAPVFPFLSDYKRIWEMDLAVDAYDELRYYFRTFDPNHLRENEVFTKLGYIDIKNMANRIKGEVLFFTGLMDKICPPSTQFAVYNRINSAKNMVIYPDFGHEGLPGANDKIYGFLTSITNEN
jgi:cephalosporin-C deacetylase